MTELVAPFPYFGGKRSVARLVWDALGDVRHYIEPFCGSCAVLLARPNHDATRHVETVNDADGHVANVWRSIKHAPDAVAEWCDWPVNHADLIARKAVLNNATGALLEQLCADDEYYDAKLAGYYVWAASCWIGHGLICPGQRPHLGDAGRGVHAKGQRPQSTDTAELGAPYNTNVYVWLRALAERLRYVRVVCGDWKRVCGGEWQTRAGRPCGVFFDPPYSDLATRDEKCYAVDSLDVAHDVRAWALERGDDPDYRIIVAGYYEEHAELLQRGWTAHAWRAGRVRQHRTWRPRVPRQDQPTPRNAVHVATLPVPRGHVDTVRYSRRGGYIMTYHRCDICGDERVQDNRQVSA